MSMVNFRKWLFTALMTSDINTLETPRSQGQFKVKVMKVVSVFSCFYALSHIFSDSFFFYSKTINSIEHKLYSTCRTLERLRSGLPAENDATRTCTILGSSMCGCDKVFSKNPPRNPSTDMIYKKYYLFRRTSL